MAPDPALLSELSSVAEALNKDSDALNHVLTEFEDLVRKMNLGFQCVGENLEEEGPYQVPDSDDESNRYYDCIELGWAKLGGEWCLCTRSVHCSVEANSYIGEAGPGNYTWVGEWEPLLKQSRHLRLKALSALDSLLRSMIQLGKHYTAQLQESIEKAKSPAKARASSK